MGPIFLNSELIEYFEEFKPTTVDEKVAAQMSGGRTKKTTVHLSSGRELNLLIEVAELTRLIANSTQHR